MQARELLHTLFSKTLAFMHSKRLSALLDAVQALLVGKKLSLSHLARNLQTPVKERHCIRKMDRLLGNRHLHAEIKASYYAHCVLLVNKIKQPIISVDWAATDKRKDWHILRATLNLEGRGYVLYQEVHPHHCLNSRKIQNSFLDKLKSMLPKECKPIIVADAGFQFPWFKKLSQIGFDFVGRVRNKTGYRIGDEKTWYGNCLELYKIATQKAKYLGAYQFTRGWEFGCNVVLCRKKKKGRKCINRSGNRTNNNAANRCARRETDPWLLVTSLEIGTLINAEKIVAIYSKRMQIEEDFRDIKSHKYGFGLRYSMSNNARRIEVLLLIAALACLVCWLISLSAKKSNLHLDYQSNSIKNRNVLSVIYLGCQLIRRNEVFSFETIKEAYFSLQELIMEASL
jgi:Transposase DDE domain